MIPRLILAAVLACAAGAAQAQQSLTSEVFARPAPLGLYLPPQALQAAARRDAGLARTSVDHSFAGRAATASLGFLCGLQPRADESVGSAHGFDDHGRFLGAKLSIAFR